MKPAAPAGEAVLRQVWLFLLMIAVLGGLAGAMPWLFRPLGPWIPWLLGSVMFGMGVTLTGTDFLRVLRRPWPVLVGLGLQYLVMPMAGWLSARLVGADPVTLAGFVLVGACPGGTASNVITYFAGADVPLSVTMTAVSTVVAPVVTPLWTELIAGRVMEVDFWALSASTLQIVVIPAALGMAAGRHAGSIRNAADRWLPGISSFLVALIIAVIVAGSRDRLLDSPGSLVAGVVLHNGLGLLLGWSCARLMGLGVTEARTVSIEVGMQNSGLAAALAAVHFPAGAGLPAAVFSVWQNVSGALAAAFWRGRPPVR